jgi:HAD superfamily hydrolase (TIGR01549 family)
LTAWTAGLRAITFDFGNTLVPVGREDLRRTVELTVEAVAVESGPFSRDAFLAAWAEERERQFAEEVPAFREVDIAQRFGRVFARLASRYRLGVLSNWPLAAAIDRYVERAGWAPYLSAVVVSQRVGTIKPHPAMFRAAEAQLGPIEARTILHVGDDWIGDVVGAKRAGWNAAYLHARPEGSPLPLSVRDEQVEADLELDRLTDLEAHL